MFHIFSVFDSAAGAYGAPFCDRSVGLAVRSFADECRREESQLAKHPQDYMLYLFGSFDEIEGKVTVLSPPKVVAEAVRFANPPKPSLPFSGPEHSFDHGNK